MPQIIFPLIALFALFFKLPGLSSCASCTPISPYLPMLGVGYFAALFSIGLSFRSLPPPWLRSFGLVWSAGLALTLTYLAKTLCYPCLIAHACHIAFWIFWKPGHWRKEKMLGMKLSLLMTTSMATMALYSALHFTLLVYGLKLPATSTLVKAGSKAPTFTLETLAKHTLTRDELGSYKGVLLNFVAPQCPFCKEQLPKLDEIASQCQPGEYRFINVSHEITEELQGLASSLEWVEDPSGSLAALFGVSGYPTAVLIDPRGTVAGTFVGTSNNLRESLKKGAQTPEE